MMIVMCQSSTTSVFYMPPFFSVFIITSKNCLQNEYKIVLMNVFSQEMRIGRNDNLCSELFALISYLSLSWDVKKDHSHEMILNDRSDKRIIIIQLPSYKLLPAGDIANYLVAYLHADPKPKNKTRHSFYKSFYCKFVNIFQSFCHL